MNRKPFLKKIVCLGLSLMFALGSAESALPAWAALGQGPDPTRLNAYFLQQVDDQGDPQKDYVQKLQPSVVQGYSIESEVEKPANRDINFFAPKPFKFQSNVAPEADLDKVIKGAFLGDRRGSVSTPVGQELYPTGEKPESMQVNVNPVFVMGLMKGRGTASKVTAATTDPQHHISFDVVADPDPVIVVDNTSIQFDLTVTKTADTYTVSAGTINKAASEGIWADSFGGKQVFIKEQRINGTNTTCVIEVNADGNAYVKYLRLRLENMQMHMPTAVDTPVTYRVTIMYEVAKPQQMAITIVKPGKGLGDVAKHMNENPMRPSLTGKETANEYQYIEFVNPNNTVKQVDGNFQLLTNFFKYHAKMNIDWDFESIQMYGETEKFAWDKQSTAGSIPAEIEGFPKGNYSTTKNNDVYTLMENYLEIRKNAGTTGAAQTLVRMRQRPEKNMVVKLRGVIKYEPKSGRPNYEEYKHVVILELNILGTGEPPAVNVQRAYKKWYYQDQATMDIIRGGETLDPFVLKMPTQPLEVYNGETLHKAPGDMQKSWNPNSIEGEILFGTLQSRADYIEVSATGDGGVEFRYGTATPDATGGLLTETPVTIRNGNTDLASMVPFSQKFAIVAKKAGTTTVHIRFFKGGKEMTDYYWKWNFKIEDHSPSSNANLKTLDLQGKMTDQFNGKELTNDQKQLYKELYPNDVIPLEPEFDPATLTYTATVNYLVGQVRLKGVYEHISTWDIDPATKQPRKRKLKVSFNGGAEEEIEEDQWSNYYELLESNVAEQTYKITVTTEAEDGTPATYTINIIKQPPSADAQLKMITVESRDGQKTQYPLKPTFNGNTLVYNVEVPYSVDKVRVIAEVQRIGAPKPEFLVGDEKDEPLYAVIFRYLMGIGKATAYRDVDNLIYDDTVPDDIKDTTTVRIRTKPEREGANGLEYTLYIKRLSPNRDRTAEVTLVRKDINEEIDVPLKPPVNRFSDPHEGVVPFKTDYLRFYVKPTSPLAKKVYVQLENETPKSKPVVPKPRENATDPLEVDPIPFDFRGLDPVAEEFNFKVWVVAEDGIEMEDPRRSPPEDYYLIRVVRKKGENGNLMDLKLDDITDQAAPKPINYGFSPTKYTYDVTVPYTTTDVQVTPIAQKPEEVTIYVNGREMSQNTVNYYTQKLTPGQMATITVIVEPDGNPAATAVYTLNILRELPSADASLKSLIPGKDEAAEQAIPFSPPVMNFYPGRFSYRIEVPEDTDVIYVKPETTDPNATFTVWLNDGKKYPGKNGDIIPLDVMGMPEGTIYVEVTAQDGVTKQTYTIDFENLKYMKQSYDALLQGLTVDYGSLSPQFTPSIFTYDLAMKPDASRVGFTPRPRDQKAQIRVYREGDSRQIPPLDGKFWSQFVYYTDEEVVYDIIVYSQAAISKLRQEGKDIDKLSIADVEKLIKEGFTAKDTIEEFELAGGGTDDNIGIRVYKIRVFLENEEVKYDLKPITEEDIDLTGDPVFIDITKYAVIQASVFQKLKTDHSDKTIILKGNDYTLEFQAKDININIPHTESYDFRMQFSSPEQIAIQDILNSSLHNKDISPVYMHSDYHGTLPAPMLLTVSLGRQYANNQLYWNYFNKERTRIDYYGYVYTNAKGSFTVPVEHFSTYIITDQAIYNAENKSGVDFGGIVMGNGEDNPGTGEPGATYLDSDMPPAGNLGYEIGKEIPQTGVK